MGLWDTFFGYSDDDEQETGVGEGEVETDEEEDEEDDGEPLFSFHFLTDLFKRKDRRQVGEDREAQEDEEEAEEEAPPPQLRKKPVRNNVIHDPRMSSQASSEPEFTHCERIVCVHQISECGEIIKCLLRGESVLLNLESIDPKDCGRVVDLLSGAAFALQGRMLKVAHLSYLLAPENVEVINGELHTGAQARYR